MGESAAALDGSGWSVSKESKDGVVLDQASLTNWLRESCMQVWRQQAIEEGEREKQLAARKASEEERRRAAAEHKERQAARRMEAWTRRNVKLLESIEQERLLNRTAMGVAIDAALESFVQKQAKEGKAPRRGKPSEVAVVADSAAATSTPPSSLVNQASDNAPKPPDNAPKPPENAPKPPEKAPRPAEKVRKLAANVAKSPEAPSESSAVARKSSAMAARTSQARSRPEGAEEADAVRMASGEVQAPRSASSPGATPLINVRGVGVVRAKRLEQAGVDSAEALARVSPTEARALALASGVPEAYVREVVANARRLISGAQR
uniref:DUF4332 domain-containing protein n=3 Tax=Chrysotila carterae TaxID=13221 RepID=A0A7S4F6A6_CHRCT